MPRILSIGQCSADTYRINRALAKTGASLDHASSAEDALEYLGQNSYDLVLINRILDGDGTSGLALITQAKQANPALKMMLVSDYADAQAQAIANGALPGFGKSELSSPQTAALVQQALTGPSM
ncbi:MAG TPA: response regulator [Phycisphaerae bacterium]|jgi:CheY-like chemotaxis protein